MARNVIPGGGAFQRYSVHPADLESIAGNAAGIAEALSRISGLVQETLWPAAAATSQADLQNALIQAAGEWQQALAARSSAIEKAAISLRSTADNYREAEVAVSATIRGISRDAFAA